jgi:probable rRNA maturation factor
MIDVRNRQRRRVNTRQLRQLAMHVLCRARIPTGVRAAGRTTAGSPAGVPALQSLSIVLVGDREMAELNLRYHHVAGPTDVLTFDYGDGQAEIIVSVDHAYARPRPAHELALYVMHGILHLRGYDDRTPAQRHRMRAAERRWLAKLGL